MTYYLSTMIGLRVVDVQFEWPTFVRLYQSEKILWFVKYRVSANNVICEGT